MAQTGQLIQETVSGDLEAVTARVGAGSGPANNLANADVGKIVKLAGESRFDLAAAGNKIEGFLIALETATQGGFSTGSIASEGYRTVTFDGSEAAGTGAIAIGDFVVAGTPVAKGTAQSAPPKVRKATNQPGAVAADLTAAADQIKNTLFAWRVVSLGSAGTGAVGTTGVIERVNS